MVKKIFIVIGILISLATTGCLRTYYPAFQETSAPPMIYETPDNLEQSSKFISADFQFSKGIHENEKIKMGKVSYLFVYTKDHFNFNARGFGYTGFYNVSGVNELYDGEKNFIGAGTDFTISGNFKISKLKIGAGVNIGTGLEFGEYYQFRRKAASEGLISKNDELFFLMLSIFPVLSYEFSEASVLSAQLNIGTPGFGSPIISWHKQGFIYWLSWIPNKDFNQNSYGHRIAAGFMINLNKL